LAKYDRVKMVRALIFGHERPETLHGSMKGFAGYKA